ncbi:MAG: penicillin-binding protein 2 [Candidatus Nanopelagicales bacterium]|nr:penicillin-binding protein 2 [Candidatus Nanopelagicales bacterium]
MSSYAPPRPPRSTPEPNAPVRRYARANGRNRAIALTFVLLMVLSIYAGRIFDLMVVQGDQLAATGQGLRMRTLPLPADRGPIYDSQGAPLAITVESRNVTADQNLIADPAEAAARLAPMLGMDQADLQRRLTGDDIFVYVAKGLSPEQWRQIQALKIRGIFSEKTTRRVYPGGTLAANVLGFVNAEGVGSGGLEMALDRRLHGVDGSRTFEQGAAGQAIPSAEDVLREPVPGQGVQLTLNRDIQYVAQRAIATRVKEAAAASGDVLVIEAKTGRVLAMATAPTFDPNDYRHADEDHMGNRPVSEIYEPGSTGKLLTLAAVVEEGEGGPRSKIVIPPTLTRAGHTTNDHTPHGTIQRTMTGVMAESSNIGTILFADRIGGDTLYEYQRKFGMGQPSGLGFPGEENGLLPHPDRWWPTTFQALAYGQSYSVTSLQVAQVYQTIANDGVRLAPRLIDGYVDADGTFEAAPTVPGTRVVSAKTARTMRKMLENVVTQGTGKPGAIPGYRVGAKTGTAERVVKGRYSGYTASFIGLAPADDPELVVAVALQDPKNGHYGSVLAGPVFNTVMKYALQELRIAPSGTQSPKLPLEW